MDQVMADHSQINHNANLLSTSLPFLTHLQICEALNDVLDARYTVNLRKFEIEKTREISNYS